MKIEIDLNDILGDDEGVETLQESVRRQVVEALRTSIQKGVGKRIDEEVSRILNEELKAQLHDKIPAMIEDVFTSEFTPVGRYGEKGEPTTFRKEIIKTLAGEMVYKKANYDSDKNAYTRAVDAVVSDNLKAFAVEFNKTCKDIVAKDALIYAVTEMKKRLGVAA